MSEWHSIKNYENLYEINRAGQVRSVDREVFDPYHNCFQKRQGRILKQGDNSRGYMFVQLWKDGIGKRFYVHRLVYEAFVEPIPPEMTINHINHMRDDNRVENLEVMTRSQNSKETNALRQVAQYTLDGEYITTYKCVADAIRALKLNPSATGIYKCCQGRTKSSAGYVWKYI